MHSANSRNILESLSQKTADAWQYIKNSPSDIAKAAKANPRALIDYGVIPAAVGYVLGAETGLFSKSLFVYAPWITATIGGGIGMRIGASAILSDVTLGKPLVQIKEKGAWKIVQEGSRYSTGFMDYPMATVIIAAIESYRLMQQFNLADQHWLTVFLSCQATGFLLSTTALVNRSQVILNQEANKKVWLELHGIFKGRREKPEPAEVQQALRAIIRHQSS